MSEAHRASRRRVETKEEETAEKILETPQQGVMLERHAPIVWESKDIVCILVTPDYCVVMNQTSGFMEARWLGPDGTGGVSADPKGVVILQESHGYTPDNIPLVSYDQHFFGVCDEIGRILIWDTSTGHVASEGDVTCDRTEAEKSTDAAVVLPSVFAISSEFIVVCKAIEGKKTRVYSLRWNENEALGMYGAPDKAFDMFVTMMENPRFARVNSDRPFEFTICSDHGIGILNLVVPAPMRCVLTDVSWLKSTYAETGDTEDADKGCAKLMHAIDLYQDRLIEWSMPEFRTKVAEAQTWSFVDAEGGIDGHKDSAVVQDHLAFVQPLRTIVPPKVPEPYRCVDVHPSDHTVIGTAPKRIVYNDRIERLLTWTNAADAIGSVSYHGGVASVTGSLCLEYCKAPFVPGQTVSTSTLLQMDTKEKAEMRATMRPVLSEEGVLLKSGAPPGAMIAAVGEHKTHIICHTFEHVVYVYTIVTLDSESEDQFSKELSDALDQLSINIQTAAQAEVVLHQSPEKEDDDLDADGKHPREEGLSLRTGDNIKETWFKIAEQAEEELKKQEFGRSNPSPPPEFMDESDDLPEVPRVAPTALAEFEDLVDDESDEPTRTKSGYPSDHIGAAAPAPMEPG